MDTSSHTIEAPKPRGCALALAIGFLVVVAANGGDALITGRPLDLTNEWAVLLSQVLIAGAPFGLLALAGVRNKAPWLVGGAMTVALWGYYLFEGIRYHFSGDTSGANIGLGLLMLVSPIPITAACFAARRLAAKPQPDDALPRPD